MIGLSKSRILSHRQCPKRLWLEKFRPELRDDAAGVVMVMAVGNTVGEIARDLYPGGILIDAESSRDQLRATREAMAAHPDVPIYEATFEHEGVLVRADVLLPQRGGRHTLIEVKSSTSVKDYYLLDMAVQVHVLEGAGLRLNRILLAHIDNQFVYPGGSRYDGLLMPVNVADAVRAMQPLVPGWVAAARQTLAGDEPDVAPGPQCHDPFACPFLGHCAPEDPEAYPVELLPRISEKAVTHLKARGYDDLRDIPAGVLTNDRHERVRQVTVSGRRYLDRKSTAALMDGLSWPRYFLDFESVNPAVPIWAGSRPFQQIPFQWSCHVLARTGEMRHEAFLADDEGDPRRAFAESLIRTVRIRGPILVYNATFEVSRLRELARDFPDLASALEAIIERVVDLLPMARDHYYHPAMRGSWSIKAVLPTIAPELAYDDLMVADGGMAQQAFLEILDAATPEERREALREGLLVYCARDTEAMVRLADFFARGK